MDTVLIRSWVSRLCFPLGITSLTLPAKSNQGRIISKEKPNLFISNFLPFGCQMETGQDISSSSLLQQPYFSSQSWTSAEVCKISSLSQTIFFLVLSNCNKLLTICLFPENKASWFGWLLSIHNPADFLNPRFPVQIHCFGYFKASCLSDCRTAVLIRGSAHRNYFSGTNYIYKHLLGSVLHTTLSIKTNTETNTMF